MAKKLVLKRGAPSPDQLHPVLILTLDSTLSPTNYPELSNPSQVDMLNFERKMLINDEVDILEMLNGDGKLIEYGCVEDEPLPGKFPLIWQWTLQDSEGRIWTDLVDDKPAEYPSAEDRDAALIEQLNEDYEADLAEAMGDNA